MFSKIFGYDNTNQKYKPVTCNTSGALKAEIDSYNLTFSGQSTVTMTGSSVQVTIGSNTKFIDIAALTGDVHVSINTAASATTAGYKLTEGSVIRLTVSGITGLYLYGSSGVLAGIVQWR